MSNEVYSAIVGNNPFFEFIEAIKITLREADWGEVHQIDGTFGIHGVSYDMDETGCFATIGFTLPDDVYAEIEDGTYGELQGFRVYRDDVEG